MVPGASWVVPSGSLPWLSQEGALVAGLLQASRDAVPTAMQKMGKGKGKKGKGEKRCVLDQACNLDAEEGLGRWPWFMQ